MAPEDVTGEIATAIDQHVARARSWKVTAGLVAAVFAAGGAAYALLSRYETRSHADQVHAAQAKQLEREVIDTAVLQALLPQLEHRFDRLELNVDHIADAVRARKEPLVEHAQPPMSLNPERKGP